MFIISTDITLEDNIIISYCQKRWNIEVSYRYQKKSLGFDEFQVESLQYVSYPVVYINGDTNVEEIINFIDTHYKTKTEPENTILIGYSLGGLATLI